ncbi:MAG: hypothetical protein ACOX0K_04530 [Oscillospiraceae bacterium]
MVKLIVGSRGSGKTKKLIEQVQQAAKVSKGNVVCIEQGHSLRFDLSYHIRLINIEEYNIKGAEAYYGFIAGLLAGNYDITEVFGDATFKILCGKHCKDMDVLADFIQRLNALTKDSEITITLTVSCAPEEIPERIREFMQ